MRFFLLFPFLLFGLTLNSQSKPGVSLSANRYHLNFYNKTRYHLEIKYGSKNQINKGRIVAPGGIPINLSGNFSKFKLARKYVRTTYTEECYQKDKDGINANFRNTKKRLADWKSDAEYAAVKDLGWKITAEGLSNVKTNSGSMWKSVGAGLARIMGNSIKFTYSVKGFLSETAKLDFDSYADLFKYLSVKSEKDKYVREAARLIEDKIGTNAKTNKYIIEAVIDYLAQTEEVNSIYESEFSKAETKKEKELSVIEKMNAARETKEYRVSDLLSGNESFKTLTPKFIISFSPLSYGNHFNSFWKSPSEAILTNENGDDEYEWSDGLWNSTLSGNFLIAISPEMKMGQNSISRLYAGINYSNVSYKLGEGISLTNNFFSQIPSGSTGFEISNPIGLEHKRIGFNATWRFFLNKKWFLDLTGGYSNQRGTLNLNNSELSEGYAWSENKIRIVENDYRPEFGGRIGFWSGKSYRGVRLVSELQFFKGDFEKITDYKILDTESLNEIPYKSDEDFLYRINFGLDVSF